MGTEQETFAEGEPEVTVTDEELFRGDEEAVEEAEATEPKVEAEAEETEEARVQRERDEKGRFKKKEEQPEEQQGHQDHRIPLRELLDERERRQQIQAQFEAMQHQMQQWQRQQQEAQQPQPDPVDIFENPEYYQEQIMQLPKLMQELQTVQQQIAVQRHEIRGDMSLMQAKAADPEKFDAAWETMAERVRAGDNTWRMAVLTSQDPGQTLMALYKRHQVDTRVGDDPDEFINKTLEEKLNDPEFLQQALERAQSMARAQPQRKVAGPVSLTKAGTSGGNRTTSGVSDADMWDATR